MKKKEGEEKLDYLKYKLETFFKRFLVERVLTKMKKRVIVRVAVTLQVEWSFFFF